MTRVAITGMGAVCGAGIGVDAFFSLLLSGRRAPSLATKTTVGPLSLCTTPLPQDLPEDRATALALCAATEALRSAGLPSLTSGALVVGTTLGAKDPWLSALRSGTVSVDKDPASWGCRGPGLVLARRHGAALVRVVSTACASGNAALGEGLALLRRGRVNLVLVGGVDALNDFVIRGFSCLRAHSPEPCKPFDRSRSGLNLGEGAGFLVLEREEHAQKRGGKILAYLCGYGSAADAVHMTGPDRTGRGAAMAMKAALVDASVERPDFVSLHGTATLFNDQMESHALHLALGSAAATVPINSIKGAIGHTLGAAGTLEAIMAVRSLCAGVIPPSAGHEELDPAIQLRVVAQEPLVGPIATVLSTSSGFGGFNAALVLSRAES